MELERRRKEMDFALPSTHVCLRFEAMLQNIGCTNVVYQYQKKTNDGCIFHDYVFLYVYNNIPFKIKIYCNDKNVEHFNAELKCKFKSISISHEITVEDSVHDYYGLKHLQKIVSLFTNTILNIISENENLINHVSDEIDNIFKKEG